jgi:uncharacterized CHY-type Zn-finger protein
MKIIDISVEALAKICPYCKRNMPNKNWKTKKGCRWCDEKYHKRKR